MAEMILVVDDETEIADLVEVYLKNEGYLVKKASCAAEALHIADTQPIALALLDVMLPDLDVSVKITSNCAGSLTSCIAQLSTNICS